MNIEEFVNDYLQEHRHDVLLSPYNGLIDFAKALLAEVAADTVHIPSCWREEDIKKSPSMYSWASIDDGKYEHGEKYYDADGHEITKEEYEALVRRPTD